MISNKSPSLVSLSLHIQLLKTFFQCGKEGPSLISNFFFRVCSKSANSEDYFFTFVYSDTDTFTMLLTEV